MMLGFSRRQYFAFRIICLKLLICAATLDFYYERTEYGSIVTPQGDLVQRSLSFRSASKVKCATECSKQAACRHVKPEGGVCILLGYSGLTGQESSRIIQSGDMVYKKHEAANCAELLELGYTEDGVYPIDPDGQGAFEVYCELNATRHDGTTQAGWTVFQRRVDDTVDFYRNWIDYENGFGDLSGNYWLGLSKLSRLTANRPVQMHVYLETFNATDNWAYALYDSFQITDSTDNYRLTISSYSGTAGDGMGNQNDMKFSTNDRDNDRWGSNCALTFKGAWWYNACHSSNLNGQYLAGSHATYADGVNWLPYKGQYYSLKTTIMKIRTSR